MQQLSTWHTIKANCIKFRILIQRFAQLWYFRKGSGKSFTTTVVHDFSRKMFLMLYSILTDQMSLPDCLYLLRCWLICVLQLLVNQPATSQIFWSNRFSTWPKRQNKNLNILRTRRALKEKKKAFFIFFKGLLIVKNGLRPDSAFVSNVCYAPMCNRCHNF